MSADEAIRIGLRQDRRDRLCDVRGDVRSMSSMGGGAGEGGSGRAPIPAWA
jgi:hypothetical protein